MIWFNVPEARKQLIENKLVYTLRPKKRREGTEPLCWDTKGIKGTVSIKLIGAFDNEEILREFIIDAHNESKIDYVKNSGFENITEWLVHATPEWPLWLYEVRLIDLKYNY